MNAEPIDDGEPTEQELLEAAVDIAADDLVTYARRLTTYSAVGAAWAKLERGAVEYVLALCNARDPDVGRLVAELLADHRATPAGLVAQ